MPLIVSRLSTSPAYRMSRRILGLTVLAGVVLVTARLIAQTPQATWTQPNVASTAQAQGFTYRLYVTPSGSTTPNVPIVLAGVTCTGAVPTVNCSAAIGPTVSATALVTGAKSILGVQDVANGTPEALSAPFTAGASAPTALRVQ